MAADIIMPLPVMAAEGQLGFPSPDRPVPLAALSGPTGVGLALFLLLSVLLLYRVGPRLWKAIEETLFSNWRLGLLALTGLVLSLASGWTTWDGLRNFTHEPLLSGMITFGIQGVMLIIAWLIGESFATGMSQRIDTAPGALQGPFQAAAGGLTGLLLFLTLALLIFDPPGSAASLPSAAQTGKLSSTLLLLAAGLLAAALVALYSGSDVVRPYLQSIRVVAKNAVLWVMFLACAATSIFFSFDSLFSAIFPQEERARAASLRAQNQVAGIVADIAATVDARRLTAASRLFETSGWQAYDRELEKLSAMARGSGPLVEQYFVNDMEQRRRGIAEQQERIATSESSQAALQTRKASLTEELAGLDAERPSLVSDLQQRKSDLDERAKEIDAKRVEATAEEKGVEGTLKEGRGPAYRQRTAELAKLQEYFNVGQQRVADAQKRVDAANARIDQLKRELAGIDGSLAQLKGEADTARERISAAAAPDTAQGPQRTIDPARVVTAFESARVAFRQKPDASGLKAIQDQCNLLRGALLSTPQVADQAKDADCDPKPAVEAASGLFDLDAGAAAFRTKCAGGDRIAALTSANELFAFARSCLTESRLSSADSDLLRTKINSIELNRDDRAHRFVVTWNAFQDGNRLAYLALAIAIAIDALIFMSGLFGANAVRSPLADVPSGKARSSHQIEAIIENALLPDVYETATLTLQAMRPITNAGGFMAEVRPERLDPHSAYRVLAVLNAGTTIHAVEHDPTDNRYLIRAELFEFLSGVAKRAFEQSREFVTPAEMEKIISVSLLPDVARNVDVALRYMHPISETEGFMAEVKLDEADERHKSVLRNLLNAGAVHRRVRRVGDGDHYLIHADLYKTLARIRARTLVIGSPAEPASEPSPPALSAAEPPVAALAAPEAPATEPATGVLSRRDAEPEHRPAPVAPVAAELPAAPVPRPMPPASLTESEIETVRQQILASMGHDPQTLDDLTQDVETASFARTACDVLRDISRLERPFGKVIKSELTDLASELHRAAGTLRQRHERLESLQQAYREIDALLPALMLMPDGSYEGLLGTAIADLEIQDGAGELGWREERLLERLKSHRNALESLGRHSAADWRRVALLLHEFLIQMQQPDTRSDASSDAGDDYRRPN